MKKVVIILASVLILGSALAGMMKYLELGPFAPPRHHRFRDRARALPQR